MTCLGPKPWLQKAQSRSYVYTLGPKFSIVQILGASGLWNYCSNAKHDKISRMLFPLGSLTGPSGFLGQDSLSDCPRGLRVSYGILVVWYSIVWYTVV